MNTTDTDTNTDTIQSQLQSQIEELNQNIGGVLRGLYIIEKTLPPKQYKLLIKNLFPDSNGKITDPKSLIQGMGLIKKREKNIPRTEQPDNSFAKLQKNTIAYKNTIQNCNDTITLQIIQETLEECLSIVANKLK